jgi:hypothetical protein
VKRHEEMTAACGEARHDEKPLDDLSIWRDGTALQEFHAGAGKSIQQAKSC